MRMHQWSVQLVREEKSVYTIKESGKYAFAQTPPKSGDRVDVGNTEYKWNIVKISETSSYPKKPICRLVNRFLLVTQNQHISYRIYTFAEDNTKLYWIGKIWEGKMAGEVLQVLRYLMHKKQLKNVPDQPHH